MVTSVSNSASTTVNPTNNAWQQNQQNFKDLTTALKSGDLDAAKAAYAKLTAGKDMSQDSDIPLAKIGQALQSGDIKSAQQDIQQIQGKHHHHGGHHSQDPSSTTSATTSSEPTVPPLSSTIGTLISTTA